MRTTLRIDDDVLAAYKRIAAETNRSLGQVIEDALRAGLRLREEVSEADPVELPVFHGTGVRPGIDINNSAELLDVMEGLDGAP